MKKPIKSKFGIMEIRGSKGRVQIENYFNKDIDSKSIPVVIHAQITGIYGKYDGDGQDFILKITKAEITK